MYQRSPAAISKDNRVRTITVPSCVSDTPLPQIEPPKEGVHLDFELSFFFPAFVQQKRPNVEVRLLHEGVLLTRQYVRNTLATDKFLLQFQTENMASLSFSRRVFLL